MDNSKYFIPAIEDIRIGYECEVQNNDQTWSNMIFDEAHIRSFAFESRQIREERTRTPRLNSNLLIKEGWTYAGTELDKTYSVPTLDVFFRNFDEGKEAEKNGGWMMDHIIYTWKLMIFGIWHNVDCKIQETQTGGFIGGSKTKIIYDGKIPSINELRYISKLLNIK